MSRPGQVYDEIATGNETSVAERARAVRHLLSAAHDAADAVRLLDMLGLAASEARSET
jgi:hypothetical protein